MLPGDLPCPQVIDTDELVVDVLDIPNADDKGQGVVEQKTKVACARARSTAFLRCDADHAHDCFDIEGDARLQCVFCHHVALE